MIVHRQVFYSGRVQGVGFRYTVKQIAAGFEVVGWVANLPDGRVELRAGGRADEMEAFLQAISESRLASGIKGIEAGDILPPPASFIGFQVR